MSDDIVARLRDTTSGYTLQTVFDEAADEIERLRAEIERLRKERDEARRWCCELFPTVFLGHKSAEEQAAAQGWDCFEEAK